MTDKARALTHGKALGGGMVLPEQGVMAGFTSQASPPPHSNSGHTEPAPTSAPSTGCPLLLNCG